MRGLMCRVAYVVVAIVAATTVARGEGTLAQVAARKTLRVGMVPGLSPFVAAGADADELRKIVGAAAPAVEHTAAGEPVTGFDVQLAGEVARALDAKLEIELAPNMDALLAGVRAGRYDLAAASITRTLDRARTVAFTDAYFSSGLQILVRDRARFATFEALRAPGATVAFRAGTTAARYAERELLGARFAPFDSDAALYAAMDAPAGPDAMVIDYVSARDAEVRGKIKTPLSAVEDRRFTAEQFAFAVKQGDPDWVAWLNLFLKQTKASGAFHKLAARYNPWFRAER
jgi:ABC-type amino acid transport substrate-binding protein